MTRSKLIDTIGSAWNTSIPNLGFSSNESLDRNFCAKQKHFPTINLKSSYIYYSNILCHFDIFSLSSRKNEVCLTWAIKVINNTVEERIMNKYSRIYYIVLS